MEGKSSRYIYLNINKHYFYSSYNLCTSILEYLWFGYLAILLNTQITFITTFHLLLPYNSSHFFYFILVFGTSHLKTLFTIYPLNPLQRAGRNVLLQNDNFRKEHFVFKYLEVEPSQLWGVEQQANKQIPTVLYNVCTTKFQ